MDPNMGPPPGLSRPKTQDPPASFFPLSSPLPPIASPNPQRAAAAPWASSLSAGLFPPAPTVFPNIPVVPQGILPSDGAVQPAGRLCNPLTDNCLVSNLANAFPSPPSTDPWHRAHVRACAHAAVACPACSISLTCCSCRSLRFTPGSPPSSPATSQHRRSRSASPALFRNDVGNGAPPPGFDSHSDDFDDDAYAQALADADTCDNSSCPKGPDTPARYTITVETFDEGTEEFYDRNYRACTACNRACKKSFLGSRIKSRQFDNSTRDNVKRKDESPHPPLHAPLPRSPPPLHVQDEPTANENPFGAIVALQDALRTLNERPSTPAAFVATICVQHDSMCSHDVSSCPVCSLGLVCCQCSRIFAPAVTRHLACASCKHVAFTCCTSTFCCKCNKFWMPTDAIAPVQLPARHFYGGAGSNSTSSPEPDIWTPSPRSSPDEIDDLTARAALPLPASRSESDASRAPSRASSVDEPVNVAATPLPTPDYSSLPTETIEGFIHPSFPERAVLDDRDKRHFLGRGDLSVTSLKLYARRIFSETSHWITAGHFLVDIFQGSTLNGSRDDFRRFVILVGTQLGFGDLAQSMSESLDVNRKMADEYMRLQDVATTWTQKAKANSKDAREGRKARDELSKAQGDIMAILEERDIFIRQRQELLKKDDELTTELNRVHRDYGAAIDDNTKLAADVDTLQEAASVAKKQLHGLKDQLSMAEHHRNKAEFDCEQAIFSRDKALADLARDRAFYEARIVALSNTPVPTSQPDVEAPIKAADAERAVLLTRIENLKKELSSRDTELAKLRSQVSLSSDVNTLRAELAEAKAVSARLSGMYEQKSKDFRESELERLSILGKQILADGQAPKDTPPTRPRPASRRGRQRSSSTGWSGRIDRETDERANQGKPTPPSSQPFWQDEPLFTKHVAAVTTATMSALPHLPFETAIATAFNTVRNVGPPPPLKMDKRPNNRRSGAPSPPTPNLASTSQGNFTFADIAKKHRFFASYIHHPPSLLAPGMASFAGPPPGLSRPKSSEENPPPPLPFFSLSFPPPSGSQVLSPTPLRATDAAWTTSLVNGLFPPSFSLPLQMPPDIQPLGVAVPPADCLRNSPITNLAVYPAPGPLDPWHIAHSRVCAHANQPCAGCSVSLVCCSCRALRFTPGPPPVDILPPHSPRRSRSASPALFRDVGNAPTPPCFDSANHDQPDDDAYRRALAECDTCDNISCPRGTDEPASWTLTVEQFDEGTEEFFDRTFRACGACNRSCKKSFMGYKVKSRAFDNSAKTGALGPADVTKRNKPARPMPSNNKSPPQSGRNPVPGSAAYARQHPANTSTAGTTGDGRLLTSSPSAASGSHLPTVAKLQDALLTLSARPATPAAFVATIRVKHDALCSHSVSSCLTCSNGLVCCGCKRLFTPAVARHLACLGCKHVAFSCCESASCCKCGKPWLPSDSVLPPPPRALASSPVMRFRGGAGSDTGATSSPEPDIWTPSPRSSPDEIDDLTARANVPLPVSRSESDTSRAPSRASSVDVPVNVVVTPLPTPDFSSLADDAVDGFVHPSFPDHAILDRTDRRHFLGRGDLSIASLKLYARRIFTDTSHWITAGHFLVDVFQGSALNGSRDDFRRFVILVGTHFGFGDLAISMSESLDVNRKMADEYMRLRDVATTWKQKAKDNARNAKEGRKAREELDKARGDIAAILEEREIFIQQRREFLAKDDQLTTELNRLHKDYGTAIEDNTNSK
ncbi:hypothetical protein AX14_002385 [Amanita brunnescens Koide BX004]|nr:hypothetical protein AX14_002385 [Amanita brunnescens Koide BX004]